MTKYGTLLGYTLQSVDLGKWRGIHSRMSAKGYKVELKMPLSAYLDVFSTTLNDKVVDLLTKFDPIKYHIKPILSNADNIIFFVKQHSFGAFADNNNQHAEFATRIIRGMARAGYEVTGRYLEELGKPMFENSGTEWRTVNVTNDYKIHLRFEEKAASTEWVNPCREFEMSSPKAPCDLGDLQYFTEPAVEVDTEYKRRINALYDQQYFKGKEKYGTILEERKELNFNARLDHMATEFLDGLQYIEHQRDMMNELIDDVSGAIAKLMQVRAHAPSISKTDAGTLLGIAQTLDKALQKVAGDNNEDESRR